jgi:hypothetical protein
VLWDEGTLAAYREAARTLGLAPAA